MRVISTIRISFRPERWLDGLADRLPAGAYFPFGDGPRRCIGQGFALLESALVIGDAGAAVSFSSWCRDIGGAGAAGYAAAEEWDSHDDSRAGSWVWRIIGGRQKIAIGYFTNSGCSPFDQGSYVRAKRTRSGIGG